jgi:hypothetical protein
LFGSIRSRFNLSSGSLRPFGPPELGTAAPVPELGAARGRGVIQICRSASPAAVSAYRWRRARLGVGILYSFFGVHWHSFCLVLSVFDSTCPADRCARLARIESRRTLAGGG